MPPVRRQVAEPVHHLPRVDELNIGLAAGLQLPDGGLERVVQQALALPGPRSSRGITEGPAAAGGFLGSSHTSSEDFARLKVAVHSALTFLTSSASWPNESPL